MVAPVMVVGQAQEGNSQPDNCRCRQEHKNENQRFIHLPQVQLDNFPLAIPIKTDRLPVTGTEGNGRLTQTDEGSRCDNRSAKCSH